MKNLPNSKEGISADQTSVIRLEVLLLVETPHLARVPEGLVGELPASAITPFDKTLVHSHVLEPELAIPACNSYKVVPFVKPRAFPVPLTPTLQ